LVVRSALLKLFRLTPISLDAAAAWSHSSPARVIALGAQRREVLRLVVGQGMRIALVGLVIGLAAAAGLTRLMANVLYDVEPTDPQTFAAVAAVLIATALGASWGPARKAAVVDPVIALHAE
jgi:putative ABC transport system permease protein